MKPKNLLKRVLQFARGELQRRARTATDECVLQPPPAQLSAMLPSDDSAGYGLEVLRPHDGGLLTLRWAVTSADVARAQTQLTGNPVLCVRLVNFTKARDDVLREVQDRPGVALSGQCEIGEPPQRAVVSLGLRAGERFVSIAHHVI